MAIFNSYVSHYQRVNVLWTWEIPVSFEVGEVDLDGSGICVANAGLT